jgi:hypothetical protein
MEADLSMKIVLPRNSNIPFNQIGCIQMCRFKVSHFGTGVVHDKDLLLWFRSFFTTIQGLWELGLFCSVALPTRKRLCIGVNLGIQF